jgi:hypothetical protein
MDDTSPRRSIRAGKTPAMVEQRIHKRPAVVSMSRVCYHSGGFVYDEKVSVLVEYFNGDIFRNCILRRGRRKGNTDELSRRYLMAGASSLAVDEDRPALDGALDFAACCILDVVCEKGIETLFLLPHRYDNVNVMRHV